MKNSIKFFLIFVLFFCAFYSEVFAQWTVSEDRVILNDNPSTPVRVELGAIPTLSTSTVSMEREKLLVRGRGYHQKIGLISYGPDEDNWITSYNEDGRRRWTLNLLDRSDNNTFGLSYYNNDNVSTRVFAISTNGNVGVKTSPSTNYALSVCGRVRCDEVRVLTPGWCDYVFERDYGLRPLEEVKQYIDEHKHLPDVTAGSVIEAEGLEVGDMASQMIRKIEELTLYMIELNEKMKEKDRQIEELQQQVKDLKK